MKKSLKRVKNTIYYYVNEVRVKGSPSCVFGDLSGISGDLSGIRGDLSSCEISLEDRDSGIDISDLVADD